MKKSLLLVFCAAILLCSNSAKAQTEKSSTFSQTESLNVVRPMLGGEWTVTIVVTDSKSAPISGALVSVPCTGQGNQYTLSNGQAVYNGSGSCPCANATITVVSGSSTLHPKIATCGATQVIVP